MIEIFILIFLIALIYSPTIQYGRVIDDMDWEKMVRKGAFKGIKNPIKILQMRLYSGCTFGLNTEADHVFTIFLHALACVLIYVAFGLSDTSFWAAILYSINPINHQTSIWLNGRRYLVNIILVLLMVICSHHGLWGRALAMIFYFSTGLFHMTAIFAPVLFGTEPILMSFGLYLIFRKNIIQIVQTRFKDICEPELRKFSPARIIVIIKCYGFYFTRMMVPGVCAMMYPNLFYWGKTKEGNKDAYRLDIGFIKGCLSLLCTGVVFFMLPRDYTYLWVFTFLAISQWCNIIPALQILADRYSSIANIFMMFFLSYFFHQCLHQYAWIPCIIIGTYYLLSLSVVMPMYQNLWTFYNYHLKNFPHIPWPRTTVIAELLQAQKIQEAESFAKEGLLVNQHDYGLLFYGAIFCLLKKDYDNGMIFIDNAEQNMFLGQEEKEKEEIRSMRENFKQLRKMEGKNIKNKKIKVRYTSL